MDHDCNEGGVGGRFFILHQPEPALPLISRSVDAILDFVFLARFLVRMMQGTIVMVKSGASADTIHQTVETALSILN